MSFEKKYRRFQKEWKQGKYKSATRTVSACVATACVVLLGVYFFQGRQAESEFDTIRTEKQEALKNGDDTDSMIISDRAVMSEYKDLFLQNPDMVGWLIIDGTKIDYPVMWTPQEPEYYSQRGFDKADSKNGLLFLDGGSDVSEYGSNLIIYGHNMKNGSMFADLMKYEKKSYWEKHPTIQFDTLYETRIYEVTAVAKENDLSLLPYDFISPSEEKATAAIGRMEDIALYDTGIDMNFGDDFLTLSTCDYSEKDGRLVVMARRVE